MSFRVITDPKPRCCSRALLGEAFPEARNGTVVECDTCLRRWTLNPLIGWLVDRPTTTPPNPPLADGPVAPSTPRPGWELR